MLLENLTPSTDDIRLSRSHSRSRRRRRSQLQVTVIVLLTLIDMAQCTERTVRTVGTSQRKRGRGTTSQAKDKLQFVSEAQSPFLASYPYPHLHRRSNVFCQLKNEQKISISF